MSEFEMVEAIASCYIQNQFEITVADVQSVLSEHSLRELSIRRQDTPIADSISLIVFDEYGDADIDNPVLWLQLILTTCETFEESENYQQWLKDEGYQDGEFFQSLYIQYQQQIPKIRKIGR